MKFWFHTRHGYYINTLKFSFFLKDETKNSLSFNFLNVQWIYISLKGRGLMTQQSAAKNGLKINELHIFKHLYSVFISEDKNLQFQADILCFTNGRVSYLQTWITIFRFNFLDAKTICTRAYVCMLTTYINSLLKQLTWTVPFAIPTWSV